MDYTAVVDLLVQVVKQALPLGIIFCLTERLVNMFLTFALKEGYKWIITQQIIML